MISTPTTSCILPNGCGPLPLGLWPVTTPLPTDSTEVRKI